VNRLVLLLVTVVVLAGCDGSAKLYDASASEQCWRDGGGSVSTATGDLDYIAADAPAAAYVRVDGFGFNASFGRSAGDAETTEGSYRAFAGGAAVDGGQLERRGNVVLAWDQVPDGQRLAWARDCLK
jgi:hypothetical protein